MGIESYLLSPEETKVIIWHPLDYVLKFVNADLC